MKSKVKDIFLENLLGLIIGSIIGLLLGIAIVILESNDIVFSAMDIPFALVFLVLSFIMAVLIHELGHLVLGLMTGFEFLSFRIFSMHFQKDESGKLRKYKHSIPGTIGQCLMIPPALNEFSLFWYNFGGVFFNLLTSLLFFALTFMIPMKLFALFNLTVASINLFFALSNWLSFSANSNDGYNYRASKKNPITKTAFYYLLDINAKVTMGTAITSLDFTAIESLEFDYHDLIQLQVGSFLLVRYFFDFNFESYEKLALHMKSMAGKNQIYKNLLEVDYYFMCLLRDGKSALNQKNKNIEKIMKSKIYKDTPSLILLKIYEDYQLNDTFDSKHYDKFVEKCQSSPQVGLSLDLLAFSKKILNIEE